MKRDKQGEGEKERMKRESERLIKIYRLTDRLHKDKDRETETQ